MISPPDVFTIEERVAMATRCRDCDPVPKVADAGMVFEQPGGQRVQIMHNGLRVVAGGYHGQWMTDLIRLCRGHHEAQEERLFHEVVKRLPANATMIELGGFWSYYSLWFLKDRPGRRSVVIEPDPHNLEVGRANAALNKLAPVFKAGFAGATFEDEVPFATEVSGVQLLPRYSVRHLLDEQGWPKIDLLHLDIQGAELEVVESCRDLFATGVVDWIFVSTHAHQISGDPLTHQRCLAVLRECGAIIEAEHDVQESFSGDGLIVARFCPAPADWSPVSLSHNRASQSLFRHLAYDLKEAQDQIAALEAEVRTRSEPSPAPITPHNVATGSASL
jgi:FkbM family methyltransferase